MKRDEYRDDYSDGSSQYFESSKRPSLSYGRSLWNMSIENLSDGHGIHPSQAVVVAVVLEELSDKLAVIGKSLTAPMIDLRTADSIHFDNLHRPLVNFTKKSSNNFQDDQYLLRQHYDTILPRHIEQINRPERLHRHRLSQAMKSLELLYHTAHGKIEMTRAFAQEVVDETVTQLIQVDIKKVRLHVVEEDKRFKMTLWDLQDTLQEHNICSEMENNYTVQTCDMLLSKSKKYCAAQENLVQEALMDMKKRHKLENVVHESMLQIINKIKSQVETKLEYWIEKYETDKENLTRSLDSLKAERQQCLDRMAWIHSKTANYKPIVKDDRRIKKIEADRLARQRLRNIKATRIQAWWRGTMVRKALGPYSAKNLAKGAKKGKGKAKAGKKKKK